MAGSIRSGARGLLTLAAAVALAPAVCAQDHPADTPPSAAPEMVHPQGEHAAPDMAAPVRPALLEGYGNGGFAITTQIPEAQAFFTNGMVLGAAFAHQAAIAAMAEAVRLDPDCAMCLWGEAFMSGPTLNYGKDKGERKPLLIMARKAQALARASGTEREQRLTDALVARYRPGRVSHRDQDFARAMERLAALYPADDTIAVMTADATLVAATKEEQYVPAGKRAMALLEPVLARSPNSTPAIHFYIHASEIAGESAKAEPYADRLGALAPHASHLVHMPSHTWYWLGRYQDAADTNMRAVAIDQANAERIGHSGHGGVFQLPYHAHNVIFGLGGAMMARDGKTALTLAYPLIEAVQERDDAEPVMQLLSAAGYFAVARFDDPDKVMALAAPKLPYLGAAWHYARGEVLFARRDSAGLRAELAAIPARIATGKLDDDTRAPEQMLGIIRAVLSGRLAMLEQRGEDAVKAYQAGALIEETPDFSRFTDPPAFWYPVRRDLAAALFAEGDLVGARREAEASLKLRPRDPVTLELIAAIDTAGAS